uniref:NADH-ubiquinone oxidoreductase chain 1 n=48 Tax=Echinococcus TaxID=6209 RepID=A0A2Z4GPV3_9CEST|nr:NADH dehydrogenase subunit 1 [Echinococcus canadensis]YP_009505042.1 NADH dehydrogenase subunit 1 [Echinococcus granulosus sensu lato genotype G6]ANF04818.1 NADH dehydrogenase subunit 1 [Echinococcus canadensis]ANF04823.1 NADH dehydrogenase subunit 1 [Echinococcus canadensis]ANF04824.1 NADH dehydrogenase subunit 1 [Echinococcus canadensis]ANF04826.1 NADH dehydrogenase subunit 1 [Echinococcus canadensis]ANF04827.1 NADH dehydrogenase subunit 1 [Echinococcus canadensis]
MVVLGLISGVFGLLISLLIIAFFVLGERKVLGYSQFRKGPNKVGIIGLLQSFADLLKLVIKFKNFYFQSRSYVGLFGVLLLIVLVVVYSFIYGSYYSVSYSMLSVLWFLAASSISSYSLLCTGWGSYNSYSFLSSVRCAFGSVSFEACFMCVVIFCALCCCGYNLIDFYYSYWWSWLLFPLIYGLFLVCVLCETNRTPFDYGEAESELVSGFNVEYSGIYFTCLFACEYIVIYIFSWLVVVLLVGGGIVGMFMLVFNLLFFMWARATLPRVRYDFFVNFFWEVCLCVLILGFFVIVN